jgi:hypothetical protein
VTGEGREPKTTDDALFVLEATAAQLLAAGDAGGRLSPQGARRLRELGEELRGQVLAVRELLTSR